MSSDLLAYIISNHDVSQFLLNYPQQDWTEILLQTVRFGIYALQVQNSTGGPSAPNKKVTADINPLKQALNTFQQCLLEFENSLKQPSIRVPKKTSKRAEQPMFESLKSPRKVDFWVQTTKNRHSNRTAKKPMQKAWVHDFSDVIKGKRKQATSSEYSPPDYPIYEPKLMDPSMEASKYSYGEDSDDDISDEMKRFYKQEYPKVMSGDGPRCLIFPGPSTPQLWHVLVLASMPAADQTTTPSGSSRTTIGTAIGIVWDPACLCSTPTM